MERSEMNCNTCFHGNHGLLPNPKDPKEMAVCKLRPRSIIISSQNDFPFTIAPDVHQDPQLYRCGSGLWFARGKTQRLWDAEEYD